MEEIIVQTNIGVNSEDFVANDETEVDKFCGVVQAQAKSYLVKKYEESLSRQVKIQRTCNSVKMMHRNFSQFERKFGRGSLEE